MSDDLFTATREHDLPPRWNERAVLWEPWKMPPGNFFICGPAAKQRERCTACGSTSEPSRAVGLIAHKRTTTRDDIEGRIRGKQPGRVAYRDLVAFRCPDCQHDTVWRMSLNEWWDLDLTDYDDNGSADPDGRW